MVQLIRGQEPLIAPFFEGATDTAVFSYLQGYMGCGWADDPFHPSCGRIIVGDFCFFGGDSDAPGAAELVSTAPEAASKTFLIAVPPHDSWMELIRKHTSRPVKLTRYAMRADSVFDRKKLQDIIDGLNGEYELRRIGRGLYDIALEQDFSRDFVCNFESAEDYAQRGLGYCVLHEGSLVAGASSYTVHNGGIEIEIATHPDYRRRGLATVCGARLILACLDRGWHPNWDAANPESAALAGRLGYAFSHEYPAYMLTQ